MTLGEFQRTFLPLGVKPKRDWMILVKERGTSKTLMNDELGASPIQQRGNVYDREVCTWTINYHTIVVCVEQQ